MKKILLTLISALAIGSCAAQEGWSVEWHGFVNPHIYADTRQVVGGREDMMLFYPKPDNSENPAPGEESNDMPSLNMLSITARLGVGFRGPDVLGAKMKGYIEGDFTGSNNATINDLRLRHAYLDMRWQNDEILMGQYWYGMTIHEIMPGTTPLNMGAPFHPYARYNQMRYTHYWGKIEAVAAAQFQLDNTSQGPLGPSTLYARRSLVPEMHLQLRYRGEHLFLGAAANSITLKMPGMEDNFTRLTYSLFARYDAEDWSLKAQTLLNNSLYEGCSMGGYYLYTDNLTMEMTGEPFHFNTVWIDLAKTSGRWRPGIFMGYAQRQDGTPSLPAGTTAQFYGRGSNMENLWRVQPRLEYAAGHGLTLAVETEYTQARYDNGPADNLRLVLDAVYRF